MKKKGFTLVELLAVIVILAVIALIAVPQVLNMIEKARIGAAEDSTYSYVKAIEDTLVANYIKGDFYDAGTYTVGDIDVKVKGTTPTNGQYVLDNNNVVTSGTFCINGYSIDYDGNHATHNKLADYCAAGHQGSGIPASMDIVATPSGFSKDKDVELIGGDSLNTYKYKINDGEWQAYTDKIEITENCTIYGEMYEGDKLVATTSFEITTIDNIDPSLTVGVIETKTNKITIPFTAIDNQSGIDTTTCVYGETTDYGKTGKIVGNTCVIENTDEDTKYFYKLETTDKVGLKKAVTGDTTSDSFSALTITATPEGVYSTSKEVTITGSTDAQIQYQIDSTTGDWTNYTDAFDVTKNCTIYARYYDGKNTSLTSSYTISTIYINASDVSYGDTTVQDALDDLYSKING